MNKISKNLIFLAGVGLLALLLAFALATLPRNASAQGYAEYPTPSISNVSQTPGERTGTINVIVEGSGFTPQAVVRFNGNSMRTEYIDSSNLIVKLRAGDYPDGYSVLVSVTNVISYFQGGSKFSNAIRINIDNSVASGHTVNQTQNNNYSGNNSNWNGTASQNGNGGADTNSDSETNKDENVSSLASSAIFGSNSLVPSGLIQWVLFAIIVLLIIIIVRKVTGATDRYHKSPLKYS